jgi:hypothetical protein
MSIRIADLDLAEWALPLEIYTWHFAGKLRLGIRFLVFEIVLFFGD